MRGRPGAVLVVTAASEIGAPLCAALSRLGVPGVLATTASDAIHRLAEDAPAAVVVDLLFSEVPAEQLVKRALVCRETHGSPIVLLTESGAAVDRDAWLALGCTELRPRDGDPRDLARTMQALLRGGGD
jgi:DNA-binding response OmpR family regulator